MPYTQKIIRPICHKQKTLTGKSFLFDLDCPRFYYGDTASIRRRNNQRTFKSVAKGWKK